MNYKDFLHPGLLKTVYYYICQPSNMMNVIGMRKKTIIHYEELIYDISLIK